MAEHVYQKNDLIKMFDSVLNKTLGEIDNIGIFDYLYSEGFNLQKGIAGTIVEQCVLGYPPDSKQEADLVVVDGDKRVSTELKVTGMRISKDGGTHFVAKEPMSITAVGIFDLAEQDFRTSHFWNKLEHMLIVYYHYLYEKAIEVHDYKDFPIKGYEFHEFDSEDEATLQRDWYYVHDFVEEIVKKHTDKAGNEWKEAVKQDYIDNHYWLREVLSYIDLAPKFPPRFRLKKPTVNSIISKHFGYNLEQLPGKYTTVSDIDAKCLELSRTYSGKTIGEIADMFGIPRLSGTGKENKGIAEKIIVRMFGGKSERLNQVALFSRFGLIAKSIVITPEGRRTEDMKLYRIDFDEMMQETVLEEDGSVRPFFFEDSELYSYFADHELFCIIFREPPKEYRANPVTGKKEEVLHPLAMNTFVGFQRLVFSDEFINSSVSKVWEDTRWKIAERELKDVVKYKKDGSPVITGVGEVSSAPNFMKSSENVVFIRGGGKDSSAESKTENVNGIKMLPQFIWLKGSAICEELNKGSKDF